MFVATSCRFPAYAALAEAQPGRLEQGLLQDVLREALLRPSARELQPGLGDPHIYVLVLYSI